MATRPNPINLFDMVRNLERQVHALSTSRRSARDETWRTPTLENSWVTYTGSSGFFGVPRYRKLSNGQVEVQGLVQGGANGTVILTLPVGYRPGQSLAINSQLSGNTAGRIDLHYTGAMTAVVSSTTYTSINCIFYAEQ